MCHLFEVFNYIGTNLLCLVCHSGCRGKYLDFLQVQVREIHCRSAQFNKLEKCLTIAETFIDLLSEKTTTTGLSKNFLCFSKPDFLDNLHFYHESLFQKINKLYAQAPRTHWN
jgi:hypothetical protein